jgi:hypothetical protein
MKVAHITAEQVDFINGFLHEFRELREKADEVTEICENLDLRNFPASDLEAIIKAFTGKEEVDCENFDTRGIDHAQAHVATLPMLARGIMDNRNETLTKVTELQKAIEAEQGILTGAANAMAFFATVKDTRFYSAEADQEAKKAHRESAEKIAALEKQLASLLENGATSDDSASSRPGTSSDNSASPMPDGSTTSGSESDSDEVSTPVTPGSARDKKSFNFSPPVDNSHGNAGDQVPVNASGVLVPLDTPTNAVAVPGPFIPTHSDGVQVTSVTGEGADAGAGEGADAGKKPTKEDRSALNTWMSKMAERIQQNPSDAVAAAILPKCARTDQYGKKLDEKGFKKSIASFLMSQTEDSEGKKLFHFWNFIGKIKDLFGTIPELQEAQISNEQIQAFAEPVRDVLLTGKQKRPRKKGTGEGNDSSKKQRTGNSKAKGSSEESRSAKDNAQDSSCEQSGSDDEENVPPPKKSKKSKRKDGKSKPVAVSDSDSE